MVRYLGEIHPGGEDWGGELVFPEEPESEAEPVDGKEGDGGEGEGEGNGKGDGKGESEGEGEDSRQHGERLVSENHSNTIQQAQQQQHQQHQQQPTTTPSPPNPPSQEHQQPPPNPPSHTSHTYSYKSSDYDLWLLHLGSSQTDLAIDAARCGNEARFINDYRGIPNPAFPPGYIPQSKKEKDQIFLKRPNAEFKVVWDPIRKERAMAVYVLPAPKRAVGKAREVGIKGGEEVVVSYGKGFWEGRRGEEGMGEGKEREGEKEGDGV